MAEWCALPDSVPDDDLFHVTCQGKKIYFRCGVKVEKGVVRIPHTNAVLHVNDEELTPLPIPEHVRKSFETYEKRFGSQDITRWKVVCAYTGETSPPFSKTDLMAAKLMCEQLSALLVLLSYQKDLGTITLAVIATALGYGHITLVFFFLLYKHK